MTQHCHEHIPRSRPLAHPHAEPRGGRRRAEGGRKKKEAVGMRVRVSGSRALALRPSMSADTTSKPARAASHMVDSNS